ncbi:MAG: hypothetical protein Q4P24_12795 [Rhodobacterales bacterium]|nr:hypothetical protein [Rhodobacterales bacterium]
MLKLKIDPALIRFEQIGAHERQVYYGSLQVMRQRLHEPAEDRDDAGVIRAGTSVLEFRWQRASEHQRIEILRAIGEKD